MISLYVGSRFRANFRSGRDVFLKKNCFHINLWLLAVRLLGFSCITVIFHSGRRILLISKKISNLMGYHTNLWLMDVRSSTCISVTTKFHSGRNFLLLKKTFSMWFYTVIWLIALGPNFLVVFWEKFHSDQDIFLIQKEKRSVNRYLHQCLAERSKILRFQ